MAIIIADGNASLVLRDRTNRMKAVHPAKFRAGIRRYHALKKMGLFAGYTCRATAKAPVLGKATPQPQRVGDGGLQSEPFEGFPRPIGVSSIPGVARMNLCRKPK